MIENTLIRLPLGAVQAEGFLHKQLELQKNGITGRMENYPDYSLTSGWLGGDGESWERGPYYVRGLIALAYVLQDRNLINRTYKWIHWALESQREDGNFGPAVMEREWWAKMPMLMAIRDYYDAEEFRGNSKDRERILTFFERYFFFQLNQLQENPLDSWAKARGGDNAEVVLWYYEELRNRTGEKKSWLLDLAGVLFEQTEDWVEIFQNTHVRHHVVNTAQAMKTPYLRYKFTEEDRCKEALKIGLQNIRSDHGRIDNLPNADEAARDNLPTRGTESCAVVEAMLSMEICGAITGESYLYDNLELYCYNSLPNAYTYDLTLHTYYQQQNQVMATQGYHGFDCDHGDSSAFGAPCGFDCCFSNTHMGYPKFVQNMWMKTADGLAAVCYGPNRVMTDWKGTQISFTQETKYPFDDAISFLYTGDPCKFSFRLRVPTWCENYEISEAAVREGEYLLINREFHPGERIQLKLHSKIEVQDWHMGGRYVRKGPLLYCLPIQAEARTVESNDFREIKYEAHKYAPNIELYPLSRWNYALCEDVLHYEAAEQLPEQPFSPEEPPCRIQMKGQILENWTLSGNKAGVFEAEGIPAEEGKQEVLQLIPYGSARLKISVFPRVVEQYAKNPNTKTFQITAQAAFESIYVSYTRYKTCSKYVILYGRSSGQYDNAVYDVMFNTYKGGGFMFSKDKHAFTVTEPGTYYIKMLAVAEGAVIASSNETEVIV